MKFKLNDKVKIVKKFNSILGGISWAQEMNNTINKIGTICYCYTDSPCSNRYKVKFSNEVYWVYIESSLELVNKEVKVFGIVEFLNSINKK